MIIYQATKQQFLEHALRDDIEDVVSRHYRDATGARVGPGEMRAWTHSLLQMAKVLHDDEIPGDAGVAIEYQVPQTSKRIDFIVTGHDAEHRPRVVIIELKQWSSSRFSDKDGIIWAQRGGHMEVEGAHPSYQAWSYAALLEDFNTAVQEGGIGLQPCAYLHNHLRDGVIDHPHYEPHIAKAPLFLKKELRSLQAFIKRHVRHGDQRQLLYRIEHGRIRPSKMLADSVLGLVQGQREFVLIDDQKLVHETVLQLAEQALTGGQREVVIVHGGPGTGKSVVAIHLLGSLIGRQRNARYVSKNAAPRAVYEARLTGSFKKSRISNLFSGSGSFHETPAKTFDVLIVDEAHRLNEKSGLFSNLGENQVKEVIEAAHCTVFFVDDDQQVTLKDIGHSDELKAWAARLGARVATLSLTSQFRCNGSDGYLAWLDNTLALRPTANERLTQDEFDFRVLDSPAELHAFIEQKNRASNKARVVAGYCWEWASKKDPKAFDIELPAFDYRRRWNLEKDGSLWIVAPESVAEVGCIHTCQGLELDYVGVIVGPDLRVVDGELSTYPKGRARSDKSLHGLNRRMAEDAAEATSHADRIIKNTYRTLMTRGMKGCYVYCTDPAVAAHLRARLQAEEPARDGATPLEAPVQPTPGPAADNVLPFRLASAEERQQGVFAVPVVDLRIAAGRFSESQSVDEMATQWAVPPDWVPPQAGLFVAQVVGESMNRRIPNGAWCLFRAQPQGTREGKIVVVQHRSIEDAETGGRFTIKRYRSEKVADSDTGWQHHRIILSPESTEPRFEPIVIDRAEEGEFAVLAEYLMTL